MKMKRAGLPAVLGAVLALIALPTGAGAFAHPQVTTMRLAVEITGIHVVDWHYQSTDDLAGAESWTVGSGTQTLGFTTRKPLPFRAILTRGKLPGGGALPPLQLQPLSSSSPLKGSLRRTGSFRHKSPPPCGEGQCGGGAPTIRTEKGSCPAKRTPVPTYLETSRPGAGAEQLTVGFGVVDAESAWSNCPPDVGGSRNNLTLANPRAVLLPDGMERIASLKRGGKLTLKGSWERAAADGTESPRCAQKLAGAGMKQCAVTEVTVEVTRLR
jgi:hypothetical protein